MTTHNDDVDWDRWPVADYLRENYREVHPFHALCRRLNPDVPATLAGALAHVNVVHADVRSLPPGSYELASMHFVAEGATEDFAEFAEFCRTFVRAVEPGGHLVAAFMENMPTH